MGEMTEDEKKQALEMREKLEKFIDRVAYRVEEALQSNEIINVFQDDFEMLGNDEAALGGKVNTTSMQFRTYIENDYCKGKRVSCIKFHPKRPYLVAMSMVDNMDFDTRAKIQGTSFESHVLILNFKDNHIITLNYILETPIEVTCMEFHPENPNLLFGGCLNGQIIVWDLSSTEHRITEGSKGLGEAGMGDEEDFKAATMNEQDEEKSQSVIKLKHMILSNLSCSHKNFVADIAFIPPTINVDKRNPSNGKFTHLISISEDGSVCIWDTRPIDKETIKMIDNWKTFNKLDLFKQDGSGELGLSRILL
jgi:WD40 repeat protein